MENAVLGWVHLHFLYAAPLLTALDAAILVIVSLRHPVQTTAASEATMWKVEFRRAERARLKLTPVWQDYRVLAALLLLLTFGVVFAFR